MNRPRSRLIRTLWAIAIGALIATCSYLLLQTKSTRAAARYEALIHELAAQNFRRSSEVLLARSGLVKHFDHLAETERALRKVHERLRTLPPFIANPDRGKILAEVRRSEEMRARSERMVEDFKRELAILSNSSGFVTTLSRDVASFTPTTPQAWRLAQMLNQALRHLLTLEVSHDRDVGRQALASLLELERESVSTDWLTSELRLITHHGKIVISKSIAVDDLIRKLAVLPQEQMANSLLGQYRQAQDKAIRLKQTQRSAFVAFLFLLGSLVAFTVIGHLRRNARALETSGVQLEKAVESLKIERNKHAELADLKSRFVSTTSHEFRTPLSVILSSAEMLLAYAEIWSKEKKEQHLIRIRTSALSMTRMLEDVLLLGRAESGRLAFSPAPFKLMELCQEVTSLAEQAGGGLGRIQTCCAEPTATVNADETLLRHILGNLLSNALKYSPKDTPVCFTAEVSGKALRFVVQDQGIGIPDEDQRHLFDSFHRGSNVGRVSGTGLGLSIVKHALDLQSGDICVKSKLGQGTTIDVHIPLQEAAE